MNKVDYNAKMKEQIFMLNGKERLLLHSCCAPCSSESLKRLSKHFDITVIYYNPNIYPESEYLKRKQEQIRLLKILNVKFMDCDYDESEFLDIAKGLETEKEGGARCNRCFLLRLQKTAVLAKEKKFDYFGTTLTISPHKNAEVINKIGEGLSEKYSVSFLYSDLKKENGYLNSINLSKEYNLYRQNYCGCRFSIIE